jgi:hypothetical protein
MATHELPSPAFGGYHQPYGDDSDRLHPYKDRECHHTQRFDNRGILTCKDCGAMYDETTLTWISNE